MTGWRSLAGIGGAKRRTFNAARHTNNTTDVTDNGWLSVVAFPDIKRSRENLSFYCRHCLTRMGALGAI